MPRLIAGPPRVVDMPSPTPVQTLRLMARLANEAQLDPQLRLLWERICKGVRQKDYISEFAAVLNWVRQNIRYSRDPRTIEQVRTPQAVVRDRTGDCDDMACLIATLVGLGGGISRYCAGAFQRGPDGQPALAHVWAEALDDKNGAWIVLDPVPERRVHQMLGQAIQVITHPAVE